MPAGASLSRSSVQVNVGGRTQLTSLVSLLLLIPVVIFAGSTFASLPKAVLSAIILVALKGMLMQFNDFPKYLAVSKLDGVLWIFVFLSTLLLDVDIGLLLGIAFALILLVLRTYRTRIHEVGEVGESGIFAETEDNSAAKRPNESVVFQVAGSVNFSNFEHVIAKLNGRLEKLPLSSRKKSVILDVSSVAYMDQTGAKAIKSWIMGDKEQIRLVAAPNANVERKLIKMGLEKSLMYPTVVDAVRSQALPEVVIKKAKEPSRSNDKGESNPAFIITEGEAQSIAASGGVAQQSRSPQRAFNTIHEE